MKKKEPMFAMFVDDWSLPGFVSGGISYLGTMEDFERYLANVREINEKMYLELAKLFDRFRAGETEVEHDVAYGNRRFLSPVTVYQSKKDTLGEMKWSCWNTWDFPYGLRAKSVCIEHLWVAFQEDDSPVFARYYKACFQEAMLEKRKLKELMGLWGFPGLIAVHENSDTETMLYLPARHFEDEQELRSDMANPVFDPEEDLQSFLFAIVGDG